MKQKFKIEIESQGDYDNKKEWNSMVMMDDAEFLALLRNLTAWLKNRKIENYQPEKDKAK